MAGPLYKSLHFSYSNRRTNPNPLRPAQILQRHATVCVSDSVGTEAFKKFYKEEFLMRNLKKVLSLVLCVAMMLSVMVVGAGAAFSDQSKIKNTEAVDACTALNIIGGYPDGSFKPEGNITRAEVTKMICVALNGGKEPNLATNATPTFSDVRTNANSAWAEKYIESCASQGIVSGVGGGKFAPAGNVTGTQLAKMLLVSLGYKSENEGFTGNAWATNVNTVASAKGLYAGLETIDPSAAITRDNAAQMVWNAMNAYEVEYKTSLIADKDGKLSTQITVQDKVVGSNNDKITLLEDKYEAKAITGTLTAVKQDNGKTTYNITIQDPQYKGEKYNDGKDITYTNVAKDYSSLKYQNVRVLVKPSKNGKDAVVYGVYATNKNTVQSGILADLKMDSTKKVKLNGTKYDLADTTSVYLNGDVLYVTASAKVATEGKFTTDSAKAETTGTPAVAVKATIKQFVDQYGDSATAPYTSKQFMQPTAVKLMATDGTTDYSILEVTTYAVAKVTSVGSDYVNVSVKNGDNSFTQSKCENDSWTWYSGIAKNDYVVLTAAGNYANNKGLIEKATVVSGKVTGTKGNPVNKVTIDGTVYEMAGKSTAMTKAPSLNSKVDMVVVNGYVYFVDTQAGAIEDVALLVEAGQKSGLGSKWEARLIFADGSDKTVDIEKYWEDKDNKETANAIGTISEANGGILVTYEKSGDTYTLTKVGTAHTYGDTDYETAGYDAYITNTSGKTDGSIKTGTFVAKNDKGNTIADVSRLYYDSNATVFVKYDGTSDASYKVVTGKVASGYDKSITKAAALADKSGNSYYGKAVYLDMSNQKSTGGSSDKTYAVALTSQSKDSSSGSTLYTVKGWNGTEEITFKSEDSFTINAGDIFEYSAAGNDLYDIDPVHTDASYYVSQYDAASGDIALYESQKNASGNYSPKGDSAIGDITTPSKINRTSIDSKDTVVLYVNSDKGIGVKAGEFDIDLAYYYDSDFWTGNAINSGSLTEDNAPNVRAYFDDDDFITVIVVDQNRNITQW